jgi:hypothetical protein
LFIYSSEIVVFESSRLLALPELKHLIISGSERYHHRSKNQIRKLTTNLIELGGLAVQLDHFCGYNSINWYIEDFGENYFAHKILLAYLVAVDETLLEYIAVLMHYASNKTIAKELVHKWDEILPDTYQVRKELVNQMTFHSFQDPFSMSSHTPFGNTYRVGSTFGGSQGNMSRFLENLGKFNDSFDTENAFHVSLFNNLNGSIKTNYIPDFRKIYAFFMLTDSTQMDYFRNNMDKEQEWLLDWIIGLNNNLMKENLFRQFSNPFR